jgi:bifunctional DNA-binding transcriptional regulator/antitoxin component of YhaV-PrlF toxin-antitoxin module
MSAAADPFHGYLTLQSRGLLALPPELRRKYQLDQPGAQVEVTERDDGVLEIRPTVAVPSHQAWFWTEAWQQREREADADIAAGRVTTSTDADSFLTDLPA